MPDMAVRIDPSTPAIARAIGPTRGVCYAGHRRAPGLDHALRRPLLCRAMARGRDGSDGAWHRRIRRCLDTMGASPVGAVSCTSARPAGLRPIADPGGLQLVRRSEEHTSELQSLMRISYAVFCLKKKKTAKT